MNSANFQIQAIRHATMLITVKGKTFLVDPMLAQKESMPASKLTANNKMNIPLTELPVPIATLIDVDAILLTHLHFDHFDKMAEEILPKDKPVFCQPGDAKKLHKLNFTKVTPVDDMQEWEGITIHRVDGSHGKGAAKKLMGKSSGYMLTADKRTLYIGGDAIYDDLFQGNLDQFQPDSIILYAGEARLICGSPITMGSDDIINTCKHASQAKVMVVHMEALNHCKLTREKLHNTLQIHDLLERAHIPEDGQSHNM